MLRSEIFTYARQMSNDSSYPKDDEMILRACQEALDELARIRLWAGYRDKRRINLTPTYTTGTVSLSSGTTVTGSGTTWSNATMADQLFAPNGENTLHEISSVTNSTTLELKADYQTVDGTSITAGSSYVIYFWSINLPAASGSPYRTRHVEAVMTADKTEQVARESQSELYARWASSPETNRPYFYAIERDISATATEQQRLLIWPAPDDTYPIDAMIDRWPNDFPASDAGYVDVPPYLVQLYKYIVMDQLMGTESPWTSRVRKATRDAKREDAKHAPAIRIGDGGLRRLENGRRWILNESS